MNPFISDFKTRLHQWKVLRAQIKQADILDDQIDLCLAFWKHAPLENRVLDWDNHDTWPDPWSMIHDNTYCTSAHSLGIAYTLMLADPEQFADVKLVLIWEPDAAIQKIVTYTHDHYLNLGFVDKTPVSQVKNAIRQNTWTWVNKRWQSLRPK